MRKKQKLNKLDQWMKAEYDRKTQEIEENLSKDGSFDPDKIDSEALFQRILAQIEEDERNKQQDKGEKKVKKGIDMYQVQRWVALFVVSVVGIFLASMTSEANRTYLKYTIRYLVGNEVVIEAGNDKERKDRINTERAEELLACQDIQEKIGIPVPLFQYEPGVRQYFGYNIELGNAMASIEYQYENVVINLRMVNNSKAELYEVAIHGKKIKEVDVMEGIVTIPVEEVKDSGDEKPTYVAKWKYKKGYYQLSGKLEEKEFLKVVKNIYY
ncbi:MAG: DUF4367 domain-containing protein [Lachnospiraceae bacterium]|nr:DUF4367 domain-containing protein [Lachnospiraceae bacterium]